MVSNTLRSKSHYHARSVSFPSRSLPLIAEFDEHLGRLRASEATSSSLTAISDILSGHEDLYDCVNDLILLQHTKQICNEKWAGGWLDGYLKLLDACATAKAIFSQTKEEVKELHSLMWRKGDASTSEGYLTSRKKAKKVIEKLRKDLKSTGNKDRDRENVPIVSMLKEVEEVTCAVLESLLSYTAGTKAKSARSGWSLVPKLMHQKRGSCQAKEKVFGEFEKIDGVVHALAGHKPSKFDDNMNIETLQNHLQELESSIEGIEEVLERLLRHLIKTRVSLLNILNN
ncbi:DNA double-strand break repair Rad50 ATPase [Actinidia chinensis var. chinensis]|uniref:DNA double-strand break repair Rad50 ATPase n=1 Tax=Actinidia chinensis var. chinensis TaxID=1590841 RepID=A0A2R6QI20_ACTCC|nr:DNA double-strand break repair Rad50 ATPase [Actinidia chinensis var. chinensis]